MWQLLNLKQALPTIIDHVGQNDGRVIRVDSCFCYCLSMVIFVCCICLFLGQECPRRYRMAKEGALSCFVPLGNMRVGDFDFSWSSGKQHVAFVAGNTDNYA